MNVNLTNKVVIVTGGNKGIGKGKSEVFAKQGATVIIAARNREHCENLVNQLTEQGYKADYVEVDVKSEESVNKMVTEVLEKYGQIDILCANAGIFPSLKLEEMTIDEWDNVLNINTRGTMLCVKACLPALKKSENGRVIVTSSITGPVTGYAGWTHYSASKAAQLGFVRTAALELAPYKITINAVLPGNIATEGLDGMGEEYLNQMKKSIPTGELGRVEDIAYAALFFASPEAKFITGQTLIIDGGQTLPENADAF